MVATNLPQHPGGFTIFVDHGKYWPLRTQVIIELVRDLVGLVEREQQQEVRRPDAVEGALAFHPALEANMLVKARAAYVRLDRPALVRTGRAEEPDA
jgi:hypothetical protein